MITIGTLFLVIGAVDKSHLVDYVARKAFGMTGSITFAKVRMLFTCFCLSIFFNNIPLVAILMPIVKDWGRVRDVAASQLLIPLSYSVLAGSFVSMIGTSTNLTVQGLMQADRGYSFNFFAPAPIGIPIFFLLLAYQVFLGPYLLPHYKSGMLRAVRDQVESLVAEVYVSTNSIFIGQSLGLMMNSLGIAPSRAIKIRRRVTPRTEEEIQADEQRKLEREKSKRKELKKSQSSNVDQTYLQRFLPFWKKSSLPDSNAESSPGDSDDYKAANAEEEEIGP
jgi:di/tricarboxylate transporter